MKTTATPLLDLCAEDVMRRDVVSLPRGASLPEASRLLSSAGASIAPVVDEHGRCVGCVSAVELLRWLEQGHPDTEATTSPTFPSCQYQVQGRLLTGETAIVCTLPLGSCPLQASRAATGGRRTTLCLQPNGIHSDWQVAEEVPAEAIARFARPEAVTIDHHAPLGEVLQALVEAHAPSVLVVDEGQRPVGFVTSTDVLAAIAWDLIGPVPFAPDTQNKMTEALP